MALLQRHDPKRGWVDMPIKTCDLNRTRRMYRLKNGDLWVVVFAAVMLAAMICVLFWFFV